MCMVLTCASSKQNAMRLKQSWPTRCNKMLFVSDKEDGDLPAIQFGGLCSDRATRISRGIAYANEHHLDNADWILIADDVTFVILENLRFALRAQVPTDAMLFAHADADGCWNMNGGFVMSRQTVLRFVARSKDTDNPCTGAGTSPADICTCMKTLNVTISDMKDEFGKSRFHCDNLLKQLQGYDARLAPLVNKTGKSKVCKVQHYWTLNAAFPMDLFWVFFYICYTDRTAKVIYRGIPHHIMNVSNGVQ